MVRINGIDASSGDGFVTWEVTVPLNPGFNMLTVETVDIAGNDDSAADSAEIERQALWVAPGPSALDAAAGALLVMDISLDALLKVDLNTGNRTIVSDLDTGTGPGFGIPIAIALDVENNRVLVANDSLDPSVLAVDLATGDRSILSENLSVGQGADFGSPQSLVVHSASDSALVVDSELAALLAVDFATGNRIVISDSDTGTGTNFSSPTLVTLDNTRALVYDHGLQSLLAVDLATGDRTVISSNSTPGTGTMFATPSGIALDAGNNRVLLADRAGFVMAVDLTSGFRTVLSNTNSIIGGTVGSGIDFRNPESIALDGAYALVADSVLCRVLKVELATGNRTVLSERGVGGGAEFSFPRGIASNTAIDKALVEDFGIKTFDLLTNTRTVLSDLEAGSGTDFISPRSVAFDPTNINRALVTDVDLDAVVAVDLTTGDRSVLSGMGVGSGVALNFPEGITVDAANNRALVLDNGLDALFAIDLADGVRTILSDSGMGTGVGFNTPVSIALDMANNRALVADSNLTALMTVDLATGDRTILSGSGPALFFPRSVALDSVSGRAVMLDFSRLMAVNPVTGDRMILSGAGIGIGPDFNIPLSIALYGDNNLALVVNAGLDALMAVDLANGQRVIWAK
jgi:hypothetical protein